MNTVRAIAGFITENRLAIGIAGGWVIREWSTVGGLAGLKNWFLTGKISPKQANPPAIEPPKS